MIINNGVILVHMATPSWGAVQCPAGAALSFRSEAWSSALTY